MKHFDQYPAAITICDLNGVINYMNEKSKKTFEKNGESLIGKNLFDCHNEKSTAMIKNMLAKDASNCYSIEKDGVKKMIFQAPWKENGVIAGMIEIAIEMPEVVPHFIR